MPNLPSEPYLMPWDFWGSEEMGFPNDPLFFLVPLKRTSEICSLGWWDGEEILWLMEKYHTSNEIVFYTLDGTKRWMSVPSKNGLTMLPPIPLSVLIGYYSDWGI